MAELVYLLCSLTSAACAALLIRSYLVSRSRILLWSSLCFAGLGCTNVLLFVDLVVLREQVDLALLRASITFLSVAVLVFGLVWDSR
jgi:predicted membrane channel-forming protein YqfA (hemolysin III family)